MKNITRGMAIALVLLMSSGCAAVLIGGGIAGGIAVSKDTAEIVKDTSCNKAWDVTHKTLDEMGVINLEDKKAGKIEANVKDSKITAQVTQLTPKSVKVTVKARKNMFPNVDLAMEIVNKINNKL
ncbi:MAG: DUF3568 family protein [Candidatus Omnitrophica bacterium]|nr:DUF3568 family protein [Candidatus Omnitrophota bacterium]